MLMKLLFLPYIVYDLKLKTLHVSCACPSKKEEHRGQAPV